MRRHSSRGGDHGGSSQAACRKKGDSVGASVLSMTHRIDIKTGPAASTLLLRPEVLRAAVLFCPMISLVPPSLPDLGGKRVFIAAGEYDPIATETHTQRLTELLTASGAVVDVHAHAGGHKLGRDDIGAAQQWLAQSDPSTLTRRNTTD